MLKIITVNKNIGLIEIDSLYSELYECIKTNALIDVMISKKYQNKLFWYFFLITPQQHKRFK